VELLGGLKTVRDIHHVAGFIMLGDCMYHLGYLTYRIGVQRQFGCFRMLPTFKDLRDGVQMVLWFLRVAENKPRFDRFSYLEKFDYWAVFWGIVVIGGSGLVLTFAVPVSGVLPGQAVTVAHTLHSDEAILAVGWIAVVHLFNVHLAPWVFPFNPAIFTGRMSARRYEEDHPLEWEHIQAAASEPQAPPARSRSGLFGRTRSAVGSAFRRAVARIGEFTRMAVTAVATGTRRVVVRVRERLVP
jgi:thiosulfate reductase cytochrome b subunit